MYLHINKNCVIRNDSVVGIFDMKSIKNTSEFKKICENLNENMIDLSEGISKTFLLTNENGISKGYILKINTDTIERRII